MHLVGDAKFQAFRARILEKIKTPEQRERERLAAAMERKKQKAARSAARAAARKVRSLVERKLGAVPVAGRPHAVPGRAALCTSVVNLPR